MIHIEDIKEEILFRYKYGNPMEALMKLNEIKRMLTRKLFVLKLVIKG
jgi:hypothetical protein